MGYRILLVDDDPHVLELAGLYLKKDGFEVLLADDGEKGLAIAQKENPDLIVLDIMMPKMDGWEVCRRVRANTSTPVIMLTAKDDDLDKILGLELGADDYMTKPFNPRELVARIKAVLRRSLTPDNPSAKEMLTFPGLSINLAQYEVKVNGQPVILTPKETELLWFLASQPGRVFTREQLLERVWGYNNFSDARTVDTHIKRLRQKLEGEESHPWHIKTIWGVGYKFEVDHP